MRAMNEVMGLFIGSLVVMAAGFYASRHGYPWAEYLGLAGLAVFLGLSMFFRDPSRTLPEDPNAIIAPADGKVMIVDEQHEATFFQGPAKRVSIFLSIFDVHVQRAPVTGVVERLEHTPGKFLAAWKAEASVENERNAIGLAEQSKKVLVHQIAGLIARRTVSWVKSGERVLRGERLGMIKFGSRVDVFVPVSASLTVKVGDRVRGGADVLGSFAS